MTQQTNIISKFWQELKRRKVLPFLIAYVAACFAIIEFFLNASETFSLDWLVHLQSKPIELTELLKA